MVQLYLNNQLCDLYGKESIATDYAIAPVSNISSRTASKSISFRIPLTANNREIIENANVIVNATTIPYSLIPAKLKANGLTQGIEFAQIKSIQDDIQVVLYGSNIDFFAQIKSLKLSDLGSQWDHVWNLANIVDSMDNTDGYIYAVIDYHADSPNSHINNSDSEIDVRALIPCVYLHSIIDKIVTEAGFTASGDFLSNADYRSVIIPCTALAVVTTMSVDESFDSASVPGTDVLLQSFSWVSRIGAAEGLKLISYHLTITNNTTGNTTEIGMIPDELVITNGIHVPIEIISDANGLTVSGTDISGFNGTDYTFRTVVTLENTTEDTLGFQFFLDKVGGTFVAIPLTANQTFLGRVFLNTILVAESLGDMKQSDLLKDTAQKFGLIIQVDNPNKIVYFKQFSEIIANIPNAIDWSEKVDYTEKPELEFSNSSYGQSNSCTYKDDDTVKKPEGTDSEILINNTSLPATNELFESPFAATESVTRLIGHQLSRIKMYTNASTIDVEIEDVEPRMLILRRENFSLDLNEGGGTLATITTVPLTHFIEPFQDFNLGFANNLLDYSADFIEAIQNFKLLTLLLRLNASDINQLDFFIPVWIEIKGQPGFYSYVSLIKQFKVTHKESTNVELSKLP